MTPLDWPSIAALIAAFAAMTKVFWPKKIITQTSITNETVDATVLGKFAELFTRIGTLEVDLKSTQVQLTEALAEIAQLRKLEEYLQARLHEKDGEIQSLRDKRSMDKERINDLIIALEDAKKRIAQLERIVERRNV